MRLVRNNDTREFTDKSGDRLVLVSAPRQRDIEDSDTAQRRFAFAGMKEMQDAGLDTERLISEAGDKTEDKTETVEELPYTVRRLRYRALVDHLVISGEKVGGEAARDAYDEMDPASAAWVDSCVEEVWSAALPTDAQREGEDARAALSTVEDGTTA